ncbi:unnamed protein product [Nezara viridula]|uniref:Uncharacterized protein n=1 Tax=Nezara viridula TaxID=85310 RepID=A0A9P0E7N9_NEZVI|nr:unnamed protein product [Nezara viridula]
MLCRQSSRTDLLTGEEYALGGDGEGTRHKDNDRNTGPLGVVEPSPQLRRFVASPAFYISTPFLPRPSPTVFFPHQLLLTELPLMIVMSYFQVTT